LSEEGGVVESFDGMILEGEALLNAQNFFVEAVGLGWLAAGFEVRDAAEADGNAEFGEVGREEECGWLRWVKQRGLFG